MQRIDRRSLCSAGLGGAAALLGFGHDHSSLLDLGWRPGPPRWAVADRVAGELVLLDDQLFVTGRLAWRAPYRLVAGAAGLWVGWSRSGHRGGDQRVGLLDPEDGSLRWVAGCGPLRGLAGGGGGGLFLLEGGARPALAHLDALGRWSSRTPLVGTHLVAGAARAIVALEEGRLVQVDARGVLHAERGVTGPVRALAATPDGGAWCATDERVVRLGPDLAPLARLRAETPLALAPLPDGGAWLLEHGGRRARRASPRGRLGRWWRLSSRAYAARGLPAGGLLAWNEGALMRLGPDGAQRPGQGGFGYVAGVAPWPIT